LCGHRLPLLPPALFRYHLLPPCIGPLPVVTYHYRLYTVHATLHLGWGGPALHRRYHEVPYGTCHSCADSRLPWIPPDGNFTPLGCPVHHLRPADISTGVVRRVDFTTYRNTTPFTPTFILPVTTCSFTWNVVHHSIHSLLPFYILPTVPFIRLPYHTITIQGRYHLLEPPGRNTCWVTPFPGRRSNQCLFDTYRVPPPLHHTFYHTTHYHTFCLHALLLPYVHSFDTFVL